MARKVSRKNKPVNNKRVKSNNKSVKSNKPMKSNNKSVKSNKKVKSNKSRKGKKLNEFFQKMLKAKKEGAKSFEYKNKTYYGRKHDTLGMVYSSKRPKTV